MHEHSGTGSQPSLHADDVDGPDLLGLRLGVDGESNGFGRQRDLEGVDTVHV